MPTFPFGSANLLAADSASDTAEPWSARMGDEVFPKHIYKMVTNMFGIFNGMQRGINQGFFQQMTRRDQDVFLQYLYDQGYSVQEISKAFGIPVPTIYSRIDANRGRGPQSA